MSEPRPIDALALLTQQDWVRRLARGLVRDRATADDLAQEAWIVAARDPGRPRDARAFLAGVVRRLASVQRRGSGRRDRRERVVARAEALPSSEALIERLELQRLLVESVQALEPHERTAIQLRFFEDLSAEEIARRSGEPAATVRSRLHRGLAHLRARLEQRVDREDLMAGLLALARLEPALPGGPGGPRPATEASVPWTLAALMKSLTAIVVTVAAVATGLLLVSREKDAPRRVDAPPETLAAALPSELVEPRLEPAETPAPLARRVESELPGAEAVPEPAAAPVEAPGLALLTLRAVDESGAGLGGVALSRKGEVVGRSTAGGMLTVELPPEAAAVPLRFELYRTGFARQWVWARLVSGVEVALGEVVLRPAGEVRGTVVDEAGRPVAGATVLATGVEGDRSDLAELRRHGPERDELSIEARVGADGRFTLADVPAGPVRVWASATDMAWTSAGPLEVRPDRRVEDVRLVLEPLERNDRIAGFVLDPEGRPVGDATVYAWFSTATYGTSLAVGTDPDGSFEFTVRQRVAHDLTVSDAQNRWAEIYWPAIDPGSTDLELAFEPVRTIAVQVVDDTGAPLPEAKVDIEALDRTLRMRTHREPVTVSTAEAEAEALPGAWNLRAPNAGFSVVAELRGFQTAAAGPYEPGEEPEELELSLEPLPGIHGRVLEPDGTPAVGAQVALVDTVSDRLLNESNGFRVLTETSAQDTTTTDADGTFTLYPPTHEDGKLGGRGQIVRADLPGYARTELAPRNYDPQEGVEVTITLLNGGAIEGQARTAPGVDPTGFLVAFSRADGRIDSLRLGADGRYRKEGLTPGPWEVRVIDTEPEAGGSSSSMIHFGGETAPPMDWSCEVIEGATTVHDLDLTDRAPSTLSGQLVVGDRGAEGWTAALENDAIRFNSEVLTSVPLAADGSFSLTVPRAGDFDLVLRGPALPSGRLELTEAVTLATGTNDWSLTLPVARLLGSGATSAGARERFHRIEWTGTVDGHDLSGRQDVQPDGEGRFDLPMVPAGHVLVRRNEPPGEGQRIATWETLLELDLAPGEARTVTLP
jgi:RNA polymerase sigma factor (sigma-70 family)